MVVFIDLVSIDYVGIIVTNEDFIENDARVLEAVERTEIIRKLLNPVAISNSILIAHASVVDCRKQTGDQNDTKKVTVN